MNEQAEPSLRIEHLRFRYPNSRFSFFLRGLEVAHGERVVLIGPSGSGKTTLLNLIAGIHMPLEGDIFINQTNVTTCTDPERRAFRIRNIGLIFQEFELLEHLTVRENILLPYFVSGALKLDATVEQELGEISRVLGIDEYLKRLPATLSQGERQRVAIGRALITHPSLLLADEPTGNLDPATTQNIMQLLTSQAERHKMTLIMVTHDHSLLPAFDRVIDLEEVVTR